MSNGMCSSACQSMEPSSSSRVICGTMMFLTMTELPETPAATRSVLNWCRLKTPEMTPDTSFSSMIWPSTTVSGWRPSKPRLTSESAPDLPASSTALTELEPMSRPTRPLLPSFFLNIAYPFLEDCDCRCRCSRRRRACAQNPRVRRAPRLRRLRVRCVGLHLSGARWARSEGAREWEGGFTADALAGAVCVRRREWGAGVAPLRLKESPLRQPGRVEACGSTPVGFAAHAHAWCAFLG